eukprot:PhF_6_TR954/c1_g1_i1/m.1783
MQKTPYVFDVSVWELYAAFMDGAMLAFTRPGGHTDPYYIADFIETRKVTALHFVPSMLEAFIAVHLPTVGSKVTSDDVERAVSRFDGVWFAYCSGEALVAPLAKKFFQLFRRSILYDLYGPTEASIEIIWHQCQRDWKRAVKPIGFPLTNCQAYILDSHMCPVPIGAFGELHLGGMQIARGYLNRPQLTAKQFVSPDPFGRGQRLYKTGDYCRFWEDGNIEYIGRMDFQVKIRGFRIELGEIESLIRSISGVDDTLVLVREDQPSVKRIVAYVVADLSSPSCPRVPDIINDLSAKLPNYMVPSAVMILGSFPMTAGGKVDRRALPLPVTEESNIVEPEGPTEQFIASVWRELFGMTQVSALANFFDLGGHSLLVVSQAAKIRSGLLVDVPLKDFFECPVLRTLAARVNEYLERADGTDVSIAITPVTRDTSAASSLYVLSYSQLRLWILNKIDSVGSAYNIPNVLIVKDKVDVARMQAAVDSLVNRHESLRTTFETVDGVPMQRVHKVFPVTVVQQSCTTKQEIDEAITTNAEFVFDLEKGPLFRVHIATLGTSTYFLFNMHHIISDGWSMKLFSQELISLFVNPKAELPPMRLQYPDYSVWQRGWLQGDILERQLKYWRVNLADLQPLNLPLDFPRPSVQTFAGSSVKVRVPSNVQAELQAMCKQHNVTMFMTLISAFSVLLTTYSAQSDIAIGTPIAGRRDSSLEDIIGFFINTIVIRLSVDKAVPFVKLIQQCRDAATNAFTHQDVPFEKVVEAVQPERDTSRNPIFQVMFVLQEASEAATAATESGIEVLAQQSNVAKFDLTMYVREIKGEGIDVELEYNTALFEKSTAERYMKHFMALLQGIVQRSEDPLYTISCLSQSETEALISNKTDAVLGTDCCTHHLFEASVDKFPDAPAICFDLAGPTLTYRELEARANRLANFLLANGVGPEVAVGLCVDRSIEMMVGILGIHKAGGAYVPLDPSYPASRSRYIVNDAEAPVLLTQSHLLQNLPSEPHIRVVCLDTQWDSVIAPYKADRPAHIPVGPENLCYVIYTSGSTGLPKGVMLQHRGVVNRLRWLGQRHPLHPYKDVLMQKTPYVFDVSVWELYAAFMDGAMLAFTRPGGHTDPYYIADFIETRKVTALHFVPSMLEAF